MSKTEYDYTNLFTYIGSSKKKIADVTLNVLISIFFIIAAITSDDLSSGLKSGIIIFFVLWGGLAFLRQYLLLKKNRKLNNV